MCKSGSVSPPPWAAAPALRVIPPALRVQVGPDGRPAPPWEGWRLLRSWPIGRDDEALLAELTNLGIAWEFRYDARAAYLFVGRLPKKHRARCGARTRAGGVCQAPCAAGAKRCRMHGANGGPKTAEGRAAISAAVTARWARWRADRAAKMAGADVPAGSPEPTRAPDGAEEETT